jgi:heparin binding hemagglutinin HbhA
MAKTTQFKFDATRPFYAAVGAGDLAVAFARSTATDVQSRVSKLDIEPKALRDQARSVVVTRVDELNKDAKALPAKVESYFNGAVADLNETVADLNGTYVELAARGKDLVARIRKQESINDVKAAAKTTVSKAKTVKTQATKATTTAKSSTKATGTAAKKTATAAEKAVSDAAEEIGA